MKWNCELGQTNVIFLGRVLKNTVFCQWTCLFDIFQVAEKREIQFLLKALQLIKRI